MTLYEVTHVDGKHIRFTVPGKDAAVKQAQHYARESSHRFLVLEEGTDNIVAVVWPDGGVDYQPKGVTL